MSPTQPAFWPSSPSVTRWPRTASIFAASSICARKNHEKLAASNLKALGLAPSDFPELAETKAFYQSQYYGIEHVSPKALFGYILLLEVLASERGVSVYAILCREHGASAASFIKTHPEEDLDHVQKPYAQLAQLSSADLRFVYNSFDQSC